MRAWSARQDARMNEGGKAEFVTGTGRSFEDYIGLVLRDADPDTQQRLSRDFQEPYDSHRLLAWQE